MPKILERLVSQLKAQGKSDEAAYAIATSSLQKSGNLKKWTTKATAKWVARGNMSPADRAIDRASKKSKRSKSDYVYNSAKNTAKLKRHTKKKSSDDFLHYV